MIGDPMTSPAPLTAERLAELRAIAEAATPTPGERKQEDGWADCPLCEGEGSVEFATYLPGSEIAAGIQVFGIGDDLTNREAFVTTFTPPVILALLALLADRERLEARAQAAEAKLAERDDRGTTHGVGCWSWGPRHYACAQARIAELEAELKASSQANMYWDAESPEEGGYGPEEIMDRYADGEVVRLQTARSLPDQYGIMLPGNDGGKEDVCVFATADEAENAYRTALAARDGGGK